MDISVIVPVYKGQKYVASIQKMVYQNVEYARLNGHPLEVELLFVNDYPAEDIVANVIFQGYDVAVVVNRVNSGIHQSRVNGLLETKGEFVLFLDQDDEITPNCLYSQYMSINDGDVIVGNGYRWINGIYRKIYRTKKKQLLSCKEAIYLKAANQIVSPGHCLIRRSAIPSTWCKNIMHENGGDDLFLWLLMFENNKKFCINHDCVYKHVDTGINLSSDLDAMYRSADNLIKLSEESRALNAKSIALYKRRIEFLKAVHNAPTINKFLIYIENMDICIAKLYAFFR